MNRLALGMALVMALGACASPRHSVKWNDVPPDPETWVDVQLAPELARRLAAHPRFAGETLTVGLPEGLRETPTRLEERLDAALESRLIHAAGLRLRARPDGSCPTPRSAYAMGFVVQAVGRESRVELRILETGSGEWIGGFADSWQGPLSRRDRTDQAAPAERREGPGTLSRPFGPAETDLAARALALSLSCEIIRSRLAMGPVRPAGDEPLAHLAAGHLATLGHPRSGAVEWQLEVSLRPEGPGLEVAVATLASEDGLVTTRTYLAREADPAGRARAPAASRPVARPAAQPPVMEAVTCGEACIGVAVSQGADATLLAIVPGRGLTNTRGCPVRIDADGRAITSFPADHATWAGFYAIQARGAAAHRLARLAARLPSTCGAEQLAAEDDWLDELAALVTDSGATLAWSTVRAETGMAEGRRP